MATKDITAMLTNDVDLAAITATAVSLTPEQLAQAERDIANTGRIGMHAFKVAIGVLFGLSTVLVFARLSLRLYCRSRLRFDDSFLTIAYICLVGGTAIMFKRIYMIYLEFAVLRGHPIASLMAAQQIDNLFEQSKWQLAFLLFLWTTIFAVKWCYFAFFHPLLRAMPKRLVRYYWFAVVFSVTSWLFLVVGEQLITCPYVGKASAKCFPELPASDTVLVALFWICPALDGLTDAMIISIPIIVLRKSQMPLMTKIGLTVFFCLSAFMLACSIIRAAGIHYRGSLDYPWQVFWLHSEACIGVIMACVTVYHSTLIGSNEVSDRFQTYFNRLFRRHRSSSKVITAGGRSRTNKGSSDRLRPSQALPKIPGGTLATLRQKFGFTHTHATNANNTTQDSEMDLLGTDYHVYIRGANALNGESGSANSLAGKKPSNRILSLEYANHVEGLDENRDSLAPRQPAVMEIRDTSGVTSFLLQLAFPQCYLAILQHRTIGKGEEN